MSTVTPPTSNESSKGSFDGVSGREIDLLNPPEEKAEAKETEAPAELPEKEDDDNEGEGEVLEGKPSDEDLAESTEDEVEDTPQKIRFAEIKSKYPELLKEFPELRGNYFFAEQIKEYFPSIDDARSAAERIEAYDSIAPQVFSGDLSSLVDAISETNPNALVNVAESIPKILYAKNEQLFFKLANPIVKNLISTAMKHGEASGNKNLELAAKYISQFVYGNINPPAEQQKQIDPEKAQLAQQLQATQFQYAQNFENGTKIEAEETIAKEIENSLELDPKTAPFIRSKLTEAILEDVNEILSKDTRFQRDMGVLWQKAYQSGFSGESKARLINAFLARAKTILPAIRQRRKAELNQPNVIRRRTNIPQNAGPSKPRSNVISSKEVKAKGMSEMDVIMQGAK